MRLPVPFIESRKVNFVLCTGLLYQDVLGKTFGLIQKTKVLESFTAVYHLSHS